MLVDGSNATADMSSDSTVVAPQSQDDPVEITAPPGMLPLGGPNQQSQQQPPGPPLHLQDLIRNTALMSESNSVLIMGPRGSGKSALVESVLKDLEADSSVQDSLITVWLNGLIHTDDNIAIEDITRQLQLRGVEQRPLGSFSEKLRLLLETLKSGSQQNKSILFVLDHFDLFTNHKNQTLLYNLFDIAQSRHSPICVLGMSCRPDVLQVLDNRVNSRFSHQKILLYDKMKFDEYLGTAKDVLSLPPGFRNWNAEVAGLLKHPEVKETLNVRYSYSYSLRDLKELLLLAVMGVGPDHPKLQPEDFKMALQHCRVDAKASILLGLSVLEVALVIAMMHLTDIYDGEPFNFEITCHELSKFFKKRMMWDLDKAVLMKAFEHLLDLEVVTPCSDFSASDQQKRFLLVRLQVDSQQVKETLEKYQNLPVQLRQWLKSSIDG